VAKQNAVRTQDARLTRTETLMFEWQPFFLMG
jgi:hypothetical protein